MAILVSPKLLITATTPGSTGIPTQLADAVWSEGIAEGGGLVDDVGIGVGIAGVYPEGVGADEALGGG